MGERFQVDDEKDDEGLSWMKWSKITHCWGFLIHSLCLKMDYWAFTSLMMGLCLFDNLSSEKRGFSMRKK